MHPIIRQIVGRCHVGESYREVYRYVISRLKNGKETYRAMSRNDRREFLAQCKLAHDENRQLYRDVMFPSYK